MGINNKDVILAWTIFYIGIDAGSISLNCVVIDQDRRIIYESPYSRHMGRIEEKLLELVNEQYHKLGRENIKAIMCVPFSPGFFPKKDPVARLLQYSASVSVMISQC